MPERPTGWWPGDPFRLTIGVLSSDFREVAVPCGPRGPQATAPGLASTEPGAPRTMTWDNEPPTNPPQSGEPANPFAPPDATGAPDAPRPAVDDPTVEST